ncbi:hypothetical protein K2173_013743 [Erythroxylum novogranatense]|uniref:Uncharacterized protein n=1 Tax=Erythroxylum novogranatense TaxID=1862640 RepID=A0AAV8SA91_9ROSI|nr:hypothetical protein K2173_013743 [Erythroxylum novogranatense]
MEDGLLMPDWRGMDELELRANVHQDLFFPQFTDFHHHILLEVLKSGDGVFRTCLLLQIYNSGTFSGIPCEFVLRARTCPLGLQAYQRCEIVVKWKVHSAVANSDF